MANSTRIYAVSFLNSRALTYGLEHGGQDHGFEIRYDIPSVCAKQVKDGGASAGVIPSIEYARAGGEYFIVPEIAIASDGPVGSILLFHRVPVHRIRKVAMDASSRTSVALARIVLEEKYGLDFESFDHPPDVSAMLESADAALVIGDPALEFADRPEPRLDLGEVWRELTDLPFVYAFWAGKDGGLTPGEVKGLIASKEQGVSALDEIAELHAANRSRPSTFYASYLKDNLAYDLGDRELSGLMAFYSLAHSRGLIPDVPELRFYPRQ
ncbi:MAG: menaquinone biosynthesis protein [Gemmatimonadetes bacterium]|nr:menaquinone biosynthesis protein [Gemmatimonadota bacterium]